MEANRLLKNGCALSDVREKHGHVPEEVNRIKGAFMYECLCSKKTEHQLLKSICALQVSVLY